MEANEGGGAWGANEGCTMHEGGMHNMRPVCMAVESCAVGLHLSPEVKGQTLSFLLPITPRIYTI